MTPRNETSSENRSDKKLLLGVAAVVAVGAIGIAVVAGLSARDDANEMATTERSARLARASTRTAPEARTDMPASLPLPVRKSVAAPQEHAAAAERATLPAFEIDPAADLWREGNRAYQSRRYDEAAAYFAADAAARPERAYTHYMHALSLWKSGRLVPAVAAMERSAERNAGSIRTQINLSRIQNERGEHEAALAAAERALAIDSENVTALYQKARSLYNLDRVDEAAACLEACIARDAAAGHAHNLLGLILLQRGDDVAALGAFEVAAALEPDVAYVQNNLGLALERGGSLEDAAAAFRRAVELDAHHGPAAVSLARVENRLPAGAPATGAELARLSTVTVPTPESEFAEPGSAERAAVAGTEEGD